MGKKKQRIGFWYGFGIHMGLCRGPINDLIEVRVGDRTAWSGTAKQSKSVWINQPKLFGGEKKEGGIQGSMEVMMGDADQIVGEMSPWGSLAGIINNDGGNRTNSGAIRATLGAGPLPAFRRACTIYYDGWVAAMNPYPKKWTFRVRRTTKGWQNDDPWYPSAAMIPMAGGAIHAMNPAHIIYECLTNKEWGRGLPPEFIDEASFRNVADVLVDEGFGLCMRWARKDSIERFIAMVIDHIGGSMHSNRTTGLVELKLIRKDYIPELLPKYTTENGLLRISENTIGTQANLPNQVIVTWKNPITNDEGTVRVQSLAAIQASGGAINTLSRGYLGIPTAALALRVAQRDLLASSMNLRRFTLEFDRRGYNIVPGSVFRISNPARGLGDIIVRVGSVDDGTSVNGRIKISAAQDVFGSPMTSFGGVEPPAYIPPDNSAKVAESQVIEIPYFHLAGTMSQADFSFVGPNAGYLGVVAKQPNDRHTEFDLAVRIGASTPDDAAQN